MMTAGSDHCVFQCLVGLVNSNYVQSLKGEWKGRGRRESRKAKKVKRYAHVNRPKVVELVKKFGGVEYCVKTISNATNRLMEGGLIWKKQWNRYKDGKFNGYGPNGYGLTIKGYWQAKRMGLVLAVVLAVVGVAKSVQELKSGQPHQEEESEPTRLSYGDFKKHLAGVLAAGD